MELYLGKKASALTPVVMSLVALALVAIQLAIHGLRPERDEGALAHPPRVRMVVAPIDLVSEGSVSQIVVGGCGVVVEGRCGGQRVLALSTASRAGARQRIVHKSTAWCRGDWAQVLTLLNHRGR